MVYYCHFCHNYNICTNCHWMITSISQEREEEGRREVVERSSRSGGGAGFSYSENSARKYTATTR